MAHGSKNFLRAPKKQAEKLCCRLTHETRKSLWHNRRAMLAQAVLYAGSSAGSVLRFHPRGLRRMRLRLHYHLPPRLPPRCSRTAAQTIAVTAPASTPVSAPAAGASPHSAPRTDHDGHAAASQHADKSSVTASATIGPLGGVLASERWAHGRSPAPGREARNKMSVTAVAGSSVAYEFEPHGIKFTVPLVRPEPQGHAGSDRRIDQSSFAVRRLLPG